MIQDLGMVSDAAENGAYTVHSQCLSWGGDIVADITGNLYLVTSNRAVFYIDINSRIATYKGLVQGLPNNYTTNGVAADQDGRLIVASASSTEGYYQVDLQTLKARRMPGKTNMDLVADLASPYLINQSRSTTARTDKKLPFIKSETVSIYPNPITDGWFRISFDGLPAGQYELQLFDLNGVMVNKQVIILNGKLQTEQVLASGAFAKGVYLVKLVGKGARAFYSDKLIVQ